MSKHLLRPSIDRQIPIETNRLVELQRQFDACRRPVGFNYVHFLLILLYDSSTAINTYPLYTLFSQLRRKLRLAEQQTEEHRQAILDALVILLKENEIILTETVEQTRLNMNFYPITSLFRLYSSMHLILFMESSILNDIRLNEIIQRVFIHEYSKDKCDYIHFCIAHGKINLIKQFFHVSDQEDNWLINKINVPSDRSWLPIHYAAYVGDSDLVEKLCTQYAHLIKPLHFVLPKSRMRDFNDNPFDYLFRASGMQETMSNATATILDLDDGNDEDDISPLFPVMNDEEEEEDDELLSSSAIIIEQRKQGRTASFTACQEALQAADADIPDADQLESSIQVSRDTLLRSITEQPKGSIYLIPSPLLLAAACPLGGDQLETSYHKIVQCLLASKLTDVDGLHHESLTKNALDYFSRHKYATFRPSSSTSPCIYYQCDALFTSSSSFERQSRISQASDDGQTVSTLSKLVYFITILNQRSLFIRTPQFDQYLLQHLLQLHSNQIQRAFGGNISINQLTVGTILEQEQINSISNRIVVRYNMHSDDAKKPQHFQIDVNYFFIDSYVDLLTDTYVSLFHTPITMAILKCCLPMVDTLLSNSTNQIWGNLASLELETCVDYFLTRRRTTFEMFTKFCLSILNMNKNDYSIQQRIFVYALASCIKRNAKIELDYLIENFSNIYYQSCEQHPTDIRHNILAYCVVRNQSVILEQLMSAFSSINIDSSHLYVLPLSNLSSTNNRLSTIVIDDKDKITTGSGVNRLNFSSNDQYRQCRRVRNMAIANQQRQNEYHPIADTSGSFNRPTTGHTRPRLSRLWRTVRWLQLGIRHQNDTNQYTQQINDSDSFSRRATTATSLHTIVDEDEDALFQRANLEVTEPVTHELAVATPVAPPLTYISMSVNNESEDEEETKPATGQTLLHIAAKLPSHEDVVRVLINENTVITSQVNSNGQIPLFCAIQSGSTMTAQLLMEADPHSLISVDDQKSSVFHYCCENKNDVLLASALNQLRRLSSSQSVRVQALQNLIQTNTDGQTPFAIACHNGSIKCLKQLFGSKWLLRRVPMGDLLTADGIKQCIDHDQLDIVIYLVSDLRRFRVIISILIDVVFTEPVNASADVIVGRRQYNILEYAILLKKVDFVKVFVSVTVPKTIEKKAAIEESLAVIRSSRVITHEPLLYDEYKRFLTRYSLPFKHEEFDSMPIQRMLKVPALIPFVPALIEQFIDNDGMDLSVVDDCLCSQPVASRCVFGRDSRATRNQKHREFTTRRWAKEHPLNLIAECDFASIYDHPLVIAAVDSKAELFGNLLYLFILILQTLYVILYTGVTIVTRTPQYYGRNYVDFEQDSCVFMCDTLLNSTSHFDFIHTGTWTMFIFRFILLLLSCAGLLKELIQILTQRGRYFRAFFLNLLEILTYSCGILFSMDTNECSKYSSIRCKYQYDFGALGVAAVWTVLLLVFVNSLKLGKYGLLFITVFLTFLKFCLIYAFIWIGYLFAFHMLLTQNPSFNTILTAIPRMIAMLTGEFNFENLFYPDGEALRGTTMAKIIFSTFVFVVHICVMNILIGLAVSDVNDFQVNAKRENLRSRINSVLNFQAKFGSICHASSRFVLTMSRCCPQILSSLKLDVSKLSIRIKPVQTPQRLTNIIQCRVGYVTMKKDMDSTLTLEQHQQQQKIDMNNNNEKILQKVDEIREELDKTQLHFTQEMHRLTMTLSKLIEK